MQNAIGKYKSVLLTLGVATVICAQSIASQATMLRDIRIGEYQDYTRIVLEFDSEPHFPSPPKFEKGLLTVTISEASPKLVRRIPFENAQRIKHLEIISRKNNRLEIQMVFNQKDGHLKSFSLQNPFRLGLDLTTAVHNRVKSGTKNQTAAGNGIPASINQQPEPIAAVTGMDQRPGSDRGQPDEPSPEEQSDSARSNDDQPSTEAPDPAVELQNDSLPQGPQTQQADQEHSPRAKDDILPTASPKMPVFVASNPPAAARPAAGKTQIQFYLVAGLVLLTVIILGLLAVTFLIRKRDNADNGQLPIDELLHKQEKRLEAINAQIDENMEKLDQH